MMRIKRILPIILSVISMVIFSGCEAVQVNERMFVQMMGIREADGIYELFLQISLPQPQGGDSSSETQNEYEVITGNGRSIEEAIGTITRNEGKEIFFGHCRLIFADSSILRDTGKLKTLAGKRISIGCPVIYCSDPEKAVSAEDENGKLVGYDATEAVIQRYHDDGLIVEAALKSVCEAAEKHEDIVLAAYDTAPSGAAVLCSDGRIVMMSLNETAAYNILNGNGGVKLGVSEGSITVSGSEKTVYCRKAGNINEYEIRLAVSCSINEIGTGDSIGMYSEETERIISESVEAICTNAWKDKYINVINGFEDTADYSVPAVFKVTVITEFD